MHIERKQLSDTEIIFYFTAPLPVIGTIHIDKTTNPITAQDLFPATLKSNEYHTLLLTQDFLYLKSNNAENLDETELIALAEIDDYTSLPNISPITDLSVSKAKIELVLKISVAPFLQKDGGDIVLKEYRNNIAYVHFLGKCQGCPFAQNTLKEKVEKTLIRYIPQIKGAVLA